MMARRASILLCAASWEARDGNITGSFLLARVPTPVCPLSVAPFGCSHAGAAWSAYMQSVNARQPQTVRMQANCTSVRAG
jgi:hypothetical protein